MNKKIRLKAKDGTVIEAYLKYQTDAGYFVLLADGVADNFLLKSQWERIYSLPTKMGQAFQAAVGDFVTPLLVVAEEEPKYFAFLEGTFGFRVTSEQINPGTVKLLKLVPEEES